MRCWRLGPPTPRQAPRLSPSNWKCSRASHDPAHLPRRRGRRPHPRPQILDQSVRSGRAALRHARCRPRLVLYPCISGNSPRQPWQCPFIPVRSTKDHRPWVAGRGKPDEPTVVVARPDAGDLDEEQYDRGNRRCGSARRNGHREQPNAKRRQPYPPALPKRHLHGGRVRDGGLRQAERLQLDQAGVDDLR